MKKLMYVLMALMLSCSITACGGKKQVEQSSVSEKTTEQFKSSKKTLKKEKSTKVELSDTEEGGFSD